MKGMSKRKQVFFGLLLLCGIAFFAVSEVFSQETLTITTYYPAPFGVYTNLRLFPSAQPLCGSIDEGTMYFDNNQHRIMVCTGDGAGHFSWQPAGGIWTRDGGNIYPNDLGWNVGIGTNNPQAILDVDSTSSGFLPPRMSTGQRNGIANPRNGMIIYNISTHAMEMYSQGHWTALGGDFGGAYSCYLCNYLALYESLGIDITSYHVDNPYTNSMSCPPGYTAQHLLPDILTGMGANVFDVIVCWK